LLHGCVSNLAGLACCVGVGGRGRREVKRAQILADNVFYPLTYSDSLNLDDMTDQTQARFRTAEALGDRRPAGTERHAEFRLGALFGLGSPPATSAPGLGSPLPTSAPGLGSPLPHLHRDSAESSDGLRHSRRARLWLR
jgi:hypothetical protein